MRQSLLFLIFIACLPTQAQRSTGEIRLTVTDAAGAPLGAAGEITSQSNQVQLRFETGPDGAYNAKNLPFGPYRITLQRRQFAPLSQSVEIHSQAPIELSLQMEIAPASTSVIVEDASTLLDPSRTGTVHYIGQETIRERRATVPSRSMLELVETQPGWLLEANGVLHPRGSEYSTQYVIDGIPLTDNRSPAFAPPLDPEDLQSMNVFTANFPAEYGRRLGGVVEVTTLRENESGFHGRAALQSGSLGTRNSYFAGQYVQGKTAASLSAQAGETDRYLDSPVEENYTNHGFLTGISGRLERDLSDADRLRFYVHRRQTGFLVPNEADQQEAGQRQDRRGYESMGQATWQRVLSATSVLNIRGMLRDVGSELWSNRLSTPIIAEQDRGFREGYLNGGISVSSGRHEWKAGAEWIAASVREDFGYHITDVAELEDGDEFPPEFRFAGRAQSREVSAYLQDLIRLGKWTISAGLRFDRYRFLVKDTAWSPRLG
ncbi:MAG: TonB-dependent receptor domain-containing protein, partial [Bryobacteraceae bacterium]